MPAPAVPAPATRPTGPARGPLVVSPENPRYFAVAGDPEGRAVYLTGSHIWNNFQDGLGPGREVPPAAASADHFDYDAYLRLLTDRGHNFVRLWRWEQFRSQAAAADFHLHMTPQPWARTGPGAATDGGPRFDLDALDPAYFTRLRERVRAAGEAGIYVAVMLFEGFGLHLSPAPDHVEGHPFHARNNVSGVGLTSVTGYMQLPLDPRVQGLQEAYVRRVVDAVHDLPNVLYEVANEAPGGGRADPAFARMLGHAAPPDWGDSTAWQAWVIDVVRRHERERGYTTHPIGMTMQYPVPDQTRVNAPLYASAAEWVSPGYDDACFAAGGAFAGGHPMAPGSPPSRWYDDPPPNDGAKVVLTDTDHYAAGKGDALWAWKSFLRGHHPILMDFGLIDVVRPLDPSLGVPPFAAYEPARLAMGDTRRYAERVDLVDMVPRGDLASTGYALASPGREYLVLQADPAGGAFTVALAAGAYALEWFAVDRRETSDGGTLAVVHDQRTRLTPPADFGGACVAYLRRTGDAPNR